MNIHQVTDRYSYELKDEYCKLGMFNSYYENSFENCLNKIKALLKEKNQQNIDVF